jgi:hypothetical protein
VALKMSVFSLYGFLWATRELFSHVMLSCGPESSCFLASLWRRKWLLSCHPLSIAPEIGRFFTSHFFLVLNAAIHSFLTFL